MRARAAEAMRAQGASGRLRFGLLRGVAPGGGGWRLGVRALVSMENPSALLPSMGTMRRGCRRAAQT